MSGSVAAVDSIACWAVPFSSPTVKGLYLQTVNCGSLVTPKPGMAVLDIADLARTYYVIDTLTYVFSDHDSTLTL
jgi:hypothetical protein